MVGYGGQGHLGLGVLCGQGQEGGHTQGYPQIQGDQSYMTACFWFLEKSNLCSVLIYSAYAGKLTFYKVPRKPDQGYPKKGSLSIIW